jgi:hypothetical protein
MLARLARARNRSGLLPPQHDCSAFTARGPLATLNDDDCSRGARRKDASTGICARPQLLYFPFKLGDALRKTKNARNTSQVDALVLAHALNLAERGDIAQGVSPPATWPALWHHEAQAVVLAQSLGVHASQLCRGGDQEDRLVDVWLFH